MPPACTTASAISGLPTTKVAVRSGSLTIRAWSRWTKTGSRTALELADTGSAANARFCEANATVARRNTQAHRPRQAANAVIELSARFTSRPPDNGRAGTSRGQLHRKLVNEVQKAASR